MKKIILLFIFLIFSACSKENTQQKSILSITPAEAIKSIKNRNLSLSQNNALKYFFYVEGIDNETQEANAEIESEYFYNLKDSTQKLIHFDNFKESNIIQIREKYILVLLNLEEEYNSLAATFKLDGTPINFLLLEKSFGTNEFSIQRDYKFLNQNTFTLSDERDDMEWLIYPIKGVKKLTSHTDINVTINEDGLFQKI